MRKSLVCVFAHPDDEAFGPGGTIAKFAKENDIYIICATRGQAGSLGHEKNIGKIREKELLKSAQIIGVKKVFFLDFIDGQLSNNMYQDAVKKIIKILDTIKPYTLMTFEPCGVSGHLDHVAISMITSYVFEHTAYAKKLFYYCHQKYQTKKIKDTIGDYFVYFPPGYEKSQIGLTVDISSVWETKVKAMKMHHSQIHDVQWLLKIFGKLPKEEYFLVLKK